MSLRHVPFGEIEAFNAIIEVPSGEQKKYEYDPSIDAIKLDAVLYDGVSFPFNYGYVPETESGDGGHLDVFIISTHPITRGTVVPARPIGMLDVIDRGKEDHKIIGIPLGENRLENIRDWADLPPDFEHAFREFYEHLPKQFNRDIHLQGFYGKDRAVKELLRTQILD